MKANSVSERFSTSGQMQGDVYAVITDYSMCDMPERWQNLCRDVAELPRQFSPIDDISGRQFVRVRETSVERVARLLLLSDC